MYIYQLPLGFCWFSALRPTPKHPHCQLRCSLSMFITFLLINEPRWIVSNFGFACRPLQSSAMPASVILLPARFRPYHDLKLNWLQSRLGFWLLLDLLQWRRNLSVRNHTVAVYNNKWSNVLGDLGGVLQYFE